MCLSNAGLLNMHTIDSITKIKSQEEYQGVMARLWSYLTFEINESKK